MAISGRSRGGHPDHGLSGVSTGTEAGSGMESQMGGAMIGPDAYGGIGVAPQGGYTYGWAQELQQMQDDREAQAQIRDFLNPMLQKFGFESVKNFLDGYIKGFDIDKYAPTQGVTTPLEKSPPLSVVETTPSVYGSPYDFSQHYGNQTSPAKSKGMLGRSDR